MPDFDVFSLLEIRKRKSRSHGIRKKGNSKRKKRTVKRSIDSETNHKRHFIKIPFINKGIEFIDLPSIFKDRSVTSAIPTYFQNSEPPIICYKYNKLIRNTVFNFNKLVSDLDIHANTPES